MIYMFKGGKNLPMGNVTDDCPIEDFSPCPQAHVSLFTCHYIMNIWQAQYLLLFVDLG